MLLEPTTLASATAMLSEALEKNYQIDPEPVFREAGLDTGRMAVPGARFSYAKLQTLWRLAEEVTGDPALGLAVGQHLRPTTLHALGYAWFASATLGGALERLARYYRVITTAPVDIQTRKPGSGVVDVGFERMDEPPHPAAIDCFFCAMLKLFRSTTDSHFSPVRLNLRRNDPGRMETYVETFARAQRRAGPGQRTDCRALPPEPGSCTGGGRSTATAAAAPSQRQSQSGRSGQADFPQCEYPAATASNRRHQFP